MGSTAAHAHALFALLWLNLAHARDSQNATPGATMARLVWVAMPGASGGGSGSKATVPELEFNIRQPMARTWHHRD